MPRLQHRPHTASTPAPPMGPVPRREDALSATATSQGAGAGANEAQDTAPGPHLPAPMAHDDWLRCAMAHWLEDDAPVAFARMGDGH
ncbi:hypothetical protein [Aquabacterium sp.]|uniref:hypothetical protein n=1 Tax=Aquabacterium sp. TaxID=1872578 RepID=UPI002487735F|nr:hypothetical protein [Aquabacterium sp.]MDI1350316.1 hypothetical protein [Aquabacterium sp.]